MKLLLAATCVLALGACASPHINWSDSLQTTSPVRSGPALSERQQLAAEMLEAISMAETSYANGVEGGTQAKRAHAMSVFREAGYNVLYYHPVYRYVLRDPNLFVLGRARSNHVIILFTGTEVADDPYDIVQDAKTNAFNDIRNDGAFYLPPGHAGFRAGVRNLIRRNFFAGLDDIETLRARRCRTESGAFIARENVALADFICRYDILEGDGPIEITVIGHSLGAGLSQVSAGAFAGLRWQGGRVVARESWPLRLRRVFAFAPPLALYTREQGNCRSVLAEDNPVEVYRRFGITEASHLVLRDGDMVPVAWNPVGNMHCVTGEHFGHYYRIPRRGDAVVEEGVDQSLWRLEFPHASRSYETAIRRWHDQVLQEPREE